MLYRARPGYEVERMEYQISDNRCMHIAKKAYEKIMKDKKIIIRALRTVEELTPKLVIEYQVIRNGQMGVYELYDIGPRPPKPKREPKEPKPKKQKGAVK